VKGKTIGLYDNLDSPIIEYVNDQLITENLLYISSWGDRTGVWNVKYVSDVTGKCQKLFRISLFTKSEKKYKKKMCDKFSIDHVEIIQKKLYPN
jgi:hypothetical protein